MMKGKSRRTTFADREDGYGGNHPRGSFEVHPGMEKKLFESFFRRAALKPEVEQVLTCSIRVEPRKSFVSGRGVSLFFLEGGL